MLSASYAFPPVSFPVEQLDEWTIRTASGKSLRIPFPIERLTHARRSFTLHLRLPFERGSRAYTYHAYDGRRLATAAAATDALLPCIREDRSTCVLADGTRARFERPISLALGDARGAFILLTQQPGDGRNLYRVRNQHGIVWRVETARSACRAVGYETIARCGSGLIAFAPQDRYRASIDPRAGTIRTTHDF